MHSSGDFLSTPNLDYEAWRDVVRLICGRYTPGGVEPNTFSGRARVRSVCGFRAVDLSCNARRHDRTHQDVRADAVDHYYALFQIDGQSRIIQNDRIMELTVGDIALVDAARPVTYACEKGSDQWWGSLQLPRRSLLAHLGSEPRCHFRRIIRAVRSVRCISSYRQAVRAYLRYHQGPLCRSGLRSMRRGSRGGNLVTLPSEALYGEKLHLQSFHTFGSSGSRRASVGTSVISGNKPAHQRDCLRQRLW